VILNHGSPRLAKPRLGLNYDRCFAAHTNLIDVTQGSQSLALGLTTTAASQLTQILFFNVTQGSQSLTLGLTMSAASQLVEWLRPGVASGYEISQKSRAKIAPHAALCC
jgi:hypothetical protein